MCAGVFLEKFCIFSVVVVMVVFFSTILCVQVFFLRSSVFFPGFNISSPVLVAISALASYHIRENFSQAKQR